MKTNIPIEYGEYSKTMDPVLLQMICERMTKSKFTIKMEISIRTMRKKISMITEIPIRIIEVLRRTEVTIMTETAMTSDIPKTMKIPIKSENTDQVEEDTGNDEDAEKSVETDYDTDNDYN